MTRKHTHGQVGHERTLQMLPPLGQQEQQEQIGLPGGCRQRWSAGSTASRVDDYTVRFAAKLREG